ncbi:hypothetical protein CPC08DRAFT_712186 [Agrocybe pediades]|nr:hypothetical protein CPC08DRAFT_712186 [Agrocybe pediades]
MSLIPPKDIRITNVADGHGLRAAIMAESASHRHGSSECFLRGVFDWCMDERYMLRSVDQQLSGEFTCLANHPDAPTSHI